MSAADPAEPSPPRAARAPIPREALGLGLGALAVLVFGGSLPFSRLAVEGFGPAFATLARAALAGLLAGAVLLATRRKLPAQADLVRLALASLCLVLGWPALTNLALRFVDASHAGVIAGTLPLATAAAGALLLRERPSRAFWAAAVAGAALVVAFGLREGGGALGPGDALVGLAVVVCALGYVVAADLTRRLPGWEVISWQLVLALPLTLPAMLLTLPADVTAAPASAWVGLAYITVLSQYVGFFAWNAGLALGGVARVSQVQLGQTFVTLAIAATLNGERVDAATWAFALAVVAVVLAGRRARVVVAA